MYKKEILITNILIKLNNCDSFCEYCYHKHDENHIEVSDRYAYRGKLKENLDKILEFDKAYFQSPIIKICGGEIFLMRDIKSFVNNLLERYDYVLIQTNGKNIDDRYLKWIVDSKRILMQISLDGHDLPMNKYRFKEEAIMERMLHIIRTLKANDIYLELTTVLNNANTARYDEFIAFLDSLPGGEHTNTLKVTPILLVDSKGIFTPTAEDIKMMDRLIENYDRYSNVLPLRIYLERLYQLLKGERLHYHCYNPIASVSYIDDGRVKCCTNILPEEALNVGNIFNENPYDVIDSFGKTKIQKLMLETNQWVPLCRKCFNFCSIYNLYFNDAVTLDELAGNNYMFNLPEVRTALEQVKERIRKETAAAARKVFV